MTTMTQPHAEATETVADGLARLLADTYALYLKTQGYHWNVTGPLFSSLHLMFEAQYVELSDAVDEIAERIRALGSLAPASFGEFSRLTTLSDASGAPDAPAMVRTLAADHEKVAITAGAVLRLAEHAGDAATIDLATRRITAHEKAGWMLRATT